VLPFSALLVLVAFAHVAQAAKTFVVTPDVTWDQMLPYVRANIVPQLSGNEFHVFVCQDQTDRTVITPFDDALGDFAKILVTQAMKTEPKVSDAIGAVTEQFRQRVSTFDAETRGRYGNLFWRALQDDPTVLPTIRTLFSSARDAKKLRCWLCEHDSTFAPRATRVPHR
jgi:hypothetical protein